MIKFDTYHVRVGFDGNTPICVPHEDCALLSRDEIETLLKEHLIKYQESNIMGNSEKAAHAIAFGIYLTNRGWKSYSKNRWENEQDDTANTEALYEDFIKSNKP